MQPLKNIPVRLERRQCNIAAGRNTAIRLTSADIIAVNDAGSSPDPRWFQEITRPLLVDEQLEVVGGRCVRIVTNPFQEMLLRFDPDPPAPTVPDEIYPSSRNVAFRRQAWAEAGGYPEWLTLTAEDALFNFTLHKIGKRFAYNPAALVPWPVPEECGGVLQNALWLRLWRGRGAALRALFCAARQLTVFLPLMLLSRNRFKQLEFRYLKNLGQRLRLAGRW